MSFKLTPTGLSLEDILLQMSICKEYRVTGGFVNLVEPLLVPSLLNLTLENLVAEHEVSEFSERVRLHVLQIHACNVRKRHRL